MPLFSCSLSLGASDFNFKSRPTSTGKGASFREILRGADFFLSSFLRTSTFALHVNLMTATMTITSNYPLLLLTPRKTIALRLETHSPILILYCRFPRGATRLSNYPRDKVLVSDSAEGWREKNKRTKARVSLRRTSPAEIYAVRGKRPADECTNEKEEGGGYKGVARGCEERPQK